jgi:predicted permease
MNPRWRRYARFWGTRVADDVDDEFAFHLEMLVRHYRARGLDERSARDAAERRFGNRGVTRQDCLTIGHRRERRMTRVQSIDALAQDARYGLRTLVRQKAWTTVALLTMALGIGASTAVFSAVNSIILNPLPYRAADRVVMVWQTDAKSGVLLGPNPRIVEAWRAQAHTIEAFEEVGSGRMTLTGRGDAAQLPAARIAADFPAFAGVPLIAGRTFQPGEMVPGGAPVVVIGEQLWRERFGGAQDVVGQQVTLDDKRYTIVGIAPARLRLPFSPSQDIGAWVPLIKDSTYFGGLVVARMRPGVSREAATAELGGIIERNGLDPSPTDKQFVVKLVRAGDLVGFRTSLFLLAGAVLLLLLVACANVAHLMLARGATREREMAIRAALGADRWRLARQLLTESTLLAAAGCVGGVLLGYLGVRVLAALRPQSLSALSLTHIDGRVLIVSIALSALAGLAFGCAAAMHAVRHSASDSLRATGPSAGGAPRTHAVRSLLVVTEMALSAMLLVGAALLVRSVVKLQQVDVGFDPHRLYSMEVNLSPALYPSGQERAAFMDRVAESARRLPGVAAVTISTGTPPGFGGLMLSPIEVEGGATIAAANAVPMNFVKPDYFRVLGIRLEGSTFTATSIAADEVIINRGFAKKFWPGETAVGKRFRFKGGAKQKADEDWKRVVGVADDVPSRGLASDRADPFLYEPIDPKYGPDQAYVTVRTRDGAVPVAALRRIVTQMDPRLVPPPVSAVEADLARTIATQRFTMTLLAVFASLAVLLSAIGLYGVIAYVVAERTREIGIRIALGATASHVARLVVLRGLALSVGGLALGLTAAVWGTRVLKSVLFGVAGTDAPSYIAAASALLAVSVLACLVPMRRAVRIDPVVAMRGE